MEAFAAELEECEAWLRENGSPPSEAKGPGSPPSEAKGAGVAGSEGAWRRLYRAGMCCLSLRRNAEAEMWMLRALEADPCRAEPALEMALHFRLRGLPLKGLHYCDAAEAALKKAEEGWNLASDATAPDSVRRSILYERTIMTFYAAQAVTLASGARACLEFMDADMLRHGGQASSASGTVLSNLEHYMVPLSRTAGASLVPVIVPDVATLCPESTRPSSISVLRCGGRWWANVRCVNYRLSDQDRFLQDADKLRTGNLLAEVSASGMLSRPARWGELSSLSPPLENFEARSYALGLEDVRLFDAQGEDDGMTPSEVKGSGRTPSEAKGSGERSEADPPRLSMSFVAAHQQYSAHSRIRQLCGRVTSTDGGASWRVEDVVRLEPPDLGSACEKNWIPVPGAGEGGRRWIYSWHPLRICREVPVEEGVARLVTDMEHPTPAFWRHMRGSSVPLSDVVPGELWLVVHFKFEGGRLHYAHAIIVLDASTLRPLRTSVPFYLANRGTVEYCIGLLPREDSLSFFFSTRDGSPQVVTVSRSVLAWVPAPSRAPCPLRPATAFVTCLYSIYPQPPSSFRGESPLEQRFAELADALPRAARLHVFCDVASEPCVRRVVQHMPRAAVHVVELLDLETSRMALIISPAPKLPQERNAQKDTLEYMLLMNAKSEFMARAARHDADREAATYLWMDAGIAKLKGVREQLPFFLDAIRRSPRGPSYDVLVAGMQAALSRDDEAAVARRVSSGILWRFAGGLMSIHAQSAQPWFERTLDTIRWVMLHSDGVLPWEVNVWAAMEARGMLDVSPCRLKWAGCATHDVGMMHTVAGNWHA